MNRFIGIALIVWLLGYGITAQKTILIDGDFTDWDDIPLVFEDDSNDGQNNGIDIRRIWMHNDEFNFYLRFELTKEIELQENNSLALYMDYDSDLSTGFKINGIGAELRFFFGERYGMLEDENDSEIISFVPIGLLVAPTVSSTEFEIAISREIELSGIDISAENEVSFRIEDNAFNGDEVPNDLGGIPYTLDPNNMAETPEVNIDFPGSSDFRLLSYNIRNDQLFDPGRRNAYERIFKAINPDIIAFQEIRDFNSSQTADLIEDFLPGETWYHKKHGFDIVTVSKYPINYSESIDGNAAFYLDVEGQEVLLINCHLPCCENDNDRQMEVDNIMRYIRDLKDGNINYQVEEGTPIIIAGDMNFVGDSNQPYTFQTGDIFFNGTYGPDFSPDWDETDLSDAAPHTTNSFGNFTWINFNGSFFPGKLDWVLFTDSKLSIDNSFNLYTPGLSDNVLSEYNLGFSDVILASDHLPVVVDFSNILVGLEEVSSINLSVFPNPTNGKLFVESDEVKISKVQIFDQVGRLMLSREVRGLNTEINLENLNNGSYFILIETAEGLITKPFLKVK